MKTTAQRLNTHFRGILLIAIVAVILIAALLVFMPRGSIDVQVLQSNSSSLSLLPHTDGTQACLKAYNSCRPPSERYNKCKQDIYTREVRCRRNIAPDDPQRDEKSNRCAAIAAQELLSCGKIQCEKLSSCDVALVRCIDALPGNGDPPVSSPTTSPRR